MPIPEKYKETHKRCRDRYNAENYETLAIRYPKGFRDFIQSHAYLTGESMAGFVKRAIEETMERDRAAIREKSKEEAAKK